MPTYVITGVSKGLGFEILRQLSSDASNTIVGLVRNKPAVEKKVSEELKDRRAKIHIVATDLDNFESLKNAAAESSSITGGAIDYLVANAAYVTIYDAFDPIGVLAGNPKGLEDDLDKLMKTNVIGNIYLYNLFMPLILKGKAKKVICISSGMADIKLCNDLELTGGSLYGISKAAMNIVTAKYNAQYKKDGVLFMGICPGMVDVGAVDPSTLTEQQIASFMELIGKFQKHAPGFQGPAQPGDAIPKVIKVWEDASLEKGSGGSFVSHTGVPDRWL
ncbi:MAG: hypothetical protein Q9160_003585 [Pyrenula sp. 1 TL-2023]